MVDKPPFGEPVSPSEVPATAQRASGLPEPAEGEPLERTTRRRQKKAVVEDRVARVEALVALPEPDFAQLSLPDDVERELILARRLKPSGAKARQIRYIAKLLAGREDVFRRGRWTPAPPSSGPSGFGTRAMWRLKRCSTSARRPNASASTRPCVPPMPPGSSGTFAQLDPPAPEDDEGAGRSAMSARGDGPCGDRDAASWCFLRWTICSPPWRDPCQHPEGCASTLSWPRRWVEQRGRLRRSSGIERRSGGTKASTLSPHGRVGVEPTTHRCVCTRSQRVTANHHPSPSHAVSTPAGAGRFACTGGESRIHA
jgi:hypothetical protein